VGAARVLISTEDIGTEVWSAGVQLSLDAFSVGRPVLCLVELQ